MNFLIIETSCSQSFVAYCSHGEIEKIPLSSMQSETLIPALEQLIAKGTPSFIAIGIGPGALTGTRVGVMAAKALSFSLKIPLLPFCSLEIFLPEKDGPFSLFGDAKSRGFYCLKGERKGDRLSLMPPVIESEGHLSTSLNLPFLASLLQKRFKKAGGKSHQEVSPLYL